MFTSADHLKILQRLRGVSITITRGATVVSTRALRGMSNGQVIGQDGTATDFTITDFMITAAQAAALVRPERGDVITQGTKTFTVTHPNPNAGPVDWFGQDETAYRIHTIED